MTRLTVIEAARAGYARPRHDLPETQRRCVEFRDRRRRDHRHPRGELIRAFGEPTPHSETSRETSRKRSETERLRAENTLLRAENEDLRQHRDRLMTLLEQTAIPAPAPKPGRALRGLLGRRSGTQDPR